MNNFRRALVEQAFNKIDADKSGELTIDDLRGIYSASQHPEVKAGKKTEDAVLQEFLKTFESLYDYNVNFFHNVNFNINFRELMTILSQETNSLNTTTSSAHLLTTINTSNL